jgi:hypothetical protein
MGLSRRRILASVVAAAGAAAVGPWTAAGQARGPEVLSGADIGFRLDGVSADGTPIGTLVVRMEGKWVAPQFQSGVRRVK